MKRALQLAALGTKSVKDNPKVGSVLVYQDRIIGEGYHMRHGEGHAEVNCINSVNESDQNLISKSTIYITLEPCFHEAKTPPCVDLIIRYKIQNVMIGTLDPNPKVSGRSVAKLKALGVNVKIGILEEECKLMIGPFTKMMSKQPWVVLKFAKSQYNYMAANEGHVWLSNETSKLYVHSMRADVDGIMIGTNTAMIDDPSLTTRLVEGDNPTRIVLDRRGILTDDLKVFSDSNPTIYVSSVERSFDNNVRVLLHDFEAENHLEILMKELYAIGIYRLMIEGGASLLRSIVKNELWDEAVIINTQHDLNEGKKAPNLLGRLTSKIESGSDIIYKIRKT